MQQLAILTKRIDSDALISYSIDKYKLTENAVEFLRNFITQDINANLSSEYTEESINQFAQDLLIDLYDDEEINAEEFTSITCIINTYIRKLRKTHFN